MSKYPSIYLWCIRGIHKIEISIYPWLPIFSSLGLTTHSNVDIVYFKLNNSITHNFKICYIVKEKLAISMASKLLPLTDEGRSQLQCRMHGGKIGKNRWNNPSMEGSGSVDYSHLHTVKVWGTSMDYLTVQSQLKWRLHQKGKLLKILTRRCGSPLDQALQQELNYQQGHL